MSELTIAEFAFPGPLRDRLVAAVLRGEKTATCGLLAEYAAEGAQLPKPGSRELVVDSSSQAVALIETTDVRVMPVTEIDQEFVVAAGEGYCSPAQWRTALERYWHSARLRAALGDPDFTVRDDTMIVAQYFRLVQALTPIPVRA